MIRGTVLNVIVALLAPNYVQRRLLVRIFRKEVPHKMGTLKRQSDNQSMKGGSGLFQHLHPSLEEFRAVLTGGAA